MLTREPAGASGQQAYLSNVPLQKSPPVMTNQRWSLRNSAWENIAMLLTSNEMKYPGRAARSQSSGYSHLDTGSTSGMSPLRLPHLPCPSVMAIKTHPNNTKIKNPQKHSQEKFWLLLFLKSSTLKKPKLTLCKQRTSRQMRTFFFCILDSEERKKTTD